MKRALYILVALSMLVSLVGCTSGSDNEELGTEVSTSATETTVEITSEISETFVEEVEDIVYADLIPDPKEYFANGKILIVDADGGTLYYFRVTNYQEGEYEAYVEACQFMGFTEISYELDNDGGKMYGAYTADGLYHVEVSMSYLIDAIDVTCKAITEEDE